MLKDSAGLMPYKPYKWEEREEEPILLAGLREVTEELVRLRAVTESKERLVRYYCPEEHVAAIRRLLTA